MPIIQPTGGHAVYVDAKKMLPHIPQNQFPAQALACSLYCEGGIRSVEIGSLMFGKKKRARRITSCVSGASPSGDSPKVYTQSHIDYLVEVFALVNKNKGEIKGLEITEEAPFLRHFSAKLKQIS